MDGHEHAFTAAQAANCAGEHGKYWEYQELLFENQKALTKEKLKEYAGQVGLDQGSFMECLNSGKYASEVEQDKTEGKKAGVNSTPAFFINGKRLLDTKLDGFKRRIDQELENKEAKAGSGL